MRPFLHESRVIDHPSYDRSLLLHDGQRVLPHCLQHIFVTPGSMGYDMVQRLMGLAHVVGTQAGRHRFHALAFAGKKQARAIGLQRDYPIQVPRGMRQAIQVSREAFLLGAWRYRVGAHDPQLIIAEC
jgi:hypothetical protein